jgi:hypothetical protein
MIKHQIPKQMQLAELTYTFVADITLQDIVKRQIYSTCLMLALCRRCKVP